MKRSILLSLDDDVIFNLKKEPNMSAYVNNVLKASLGGGSTEEQLKKSIKEKEDRINKDINDVEEMKEKLKNCYKLVVRRY